MQYDYSKLKHDKLLKLVEKQAKIIEALMNRWEKVFDLASDYDELAIKLWKIETEEPYILGD